MTASSAGKRELGGKAVAVLAVVGAVLIGVLVWRVFRGAANNENFPEGTLWLCPNGHQFTMTMKQLGDHHKEHYGEPVPCPTCKAPSMRAVKCANCGAVSAAQRNSNICPVCKKPLGGQP